MKSRRNLIPVVAIGLIVAAVLLLAHSASPPAFAQTSTDPNKNVPPFDFSDSIYKQNGINLSLLAGPGGRVGVTPNGQPCTQTAATGPNPSCNVGNFGFVNAAGQLNWVTDAANTDPTRASTRLVQTTGGFNREGNLIYYSIFGTPIDDTFFDDADCPKSSDPTFDFTGCGTRANNLANQFRAFISPKQRYPVNGVSQLIFPGSSCTTVDTTVGTDPLGSHPQPIVVDKNCASSSGQIKFGPPPGNRRQDNIFDTQPTYFCENLLGLWILTFDLYTPKAYLPNGQYASAAAQAAISPIAAANGTTTDGTAVLKRISEVDSLTAQGFVQQFVMPRAQQVLGAAPRYVV